MVVIQPLSTRLIKPNFCCKLIAHFVEIKNLHDNLSVRVAFKVFFNMRMPKTAIRHENEAKYNCYEMWAKETFLLFNLCWET